MNIRQVFATNLRRIRHESGLSQEDLAHEAEIDRAYVSRLERAIPYVGLEVVEKLASVLKVEPMEFLRTPTRSRR